MVSTIRVGDLDLPCALSRDPVTTGGHIEVGELHSLCVTLECSVILFTEEALMRRQDSVNETVQVFIRDADGAVAEKV